MSNLQQEVIESILRPAAHGFQKRFWHAFAPLGLRQDDTVPVQTAVDLIKKFHIWMFDQIFYEESATRFHTLDGYALALYDACKTAREEFQREHAQELDSHMRAKLEFAHSDLLRAAHIAMRKAQFFEHLQQAASPNPTLVEGPPVRSSPNVYEFAVALHFWNRQLTVHFAYLRWMKETGNTLLHDMVSSKDPSGGVHNPVATLNAETLTGVDYFKNRILSDMPDEFDTAQVRYRFRNSKKTKDRKNTNATCAWTQFHSISSKLDNQALTTMSLYVPLQHNN